MMKAQIYCLSLLIFTGLLISTPSVQAANLNILVMGDSLSAGYGIDDEEGWVHLLALHLKPLSSNFSVINASISGETTDGGLRRFKSTFDTHQPVVVILELGANDGLRGFPLERTHDNLSQMIEYSQTQGAQVLIVGNRLPPNYGKKYTEAFFSMYSRLAKDYQTALMPFMLEGVAINPELMQSDRLHPTAEAQPIILRNLLPFLEPLLNTLLSSTQ